MMLSNEAGGVRSVESLCVERKSGDDGTKFVSVG